MIYLMRHAETQWNFEMRKQGLDDSPLTDKGRKQAAGYGRVLRHLFDSGEIERDNVVIYASPLGRTRVTAQYLIEALAIDPDKVHYEPRLIEFDYGDWSGKTNDEIEQIYPGMLELRECDKWNFKVPGGESYQEVEAKALSWIEDLPEDKTVLAVTHSVVSRVIRALYLSLPKAEAGGLEHPQDVLFRLHDGAIDVININL